MEGGYERNKVLKTLAEMVYEISLETLGVSQGETMKELSRQ